MYPCIHDAWWIICVLYIINNENGIDDTGMTMMLEHYHFLCKEFVFESTGPEAGNHFVTYKILFLIQL